jgi:hypothetical protein
MASGPGITMLSRIFHAMSMEPMYRQGGYLANHCYLVWNRATQDTHAMCPGVCPLESSRYGMYSFPHDLLGSMLNGLGRALHRYCEYGMLISHMHREWTDLLSGVLLCSLLPAWYADCYHHKGRWQVYSIRAIIKVFLHVSIHVHHY